MYEIIAPRLFRGHQENENTNVYNSHNLALLYNSLGGYKKVKDIYFQVLEDNKQKLGEEHPTIATILNNISNFYALQEKYKEAESYYDQARILKEKIMPLPGISNTKGWIHEQLQTRIAEVKFWLDWDNTTGGAKKWWEVFENGNTQRLPLVLRVVEELANRRVTITEFYQAYLDSDTDNIQAILDYLYYTRKKKEKELRKKEDIQPESNDPPKAKNLEKEKKTLIYSNNNNLVSDKKMLTQNASTSYGSASEENKGRRLLATPSEIVRYLDKFVQGQARAKRDLAVATYNHYLGLAYRDYSDVCDEDQLFSEFDFDPHHVLLIGPTGSGKSYIVKLIAEFLGVPYSFASATALVQTGYIGTRIEDMIEALYIRCNKDVCLTQKAIIFIDEIDKIRANRASTGPDVSGEGVQNALLTLLDGQLVTIPATSDRNGEKVDIDSSGVLFICTGSFVGLPEIIRARVRGDGQLASTRLSSVKNSLQDLTDYEAIARSQVQDFINFGFIPEFISRFSTITATQALDVADLVDILVNTQSSTLLKYKRLFALHGIDLEFTPEALQAIAERALGLATGARALVRILKECLADIIYQLPDLADAGVCSVTIRASTVCEGQSASLKYHENNFKSATDKLEKLRALVFDPSVTNLKQLLPGSDKFSNPKVMSDVQIRKRLEAIKQEKIDWESTTGSARKWWEAFENENQHRLPQVLRLAEELATMNPPATITEFFLAYVYSNTDNIQANLHYLQYTRLKKAEEQRKKEAKHNTEEKISEQLETFEET